MAKRTEKTQAEMIEDDFKKAMALPEYTPLRIACKARDLKTVKSLIDAGADVNEVREGWTALLQAIMAHDRDLVELLLDSGADPNVSTWNNPPLAVAAALGEPHIAEVLIKHKANVNPPECTCPSASPLSAAAEHGHTRIITMLLAAGADINAQDWSGWSVLHEAVFHGRTDAAQMLVDAGANKVDTSGWVYEH